jgi:hypothetical protein
VPRPVTYLYGELIREPLTLGRLEGGHSDKVILTNSPEEALKDADIAVTDTWYVLAWANVTSFCR